MEPPTSAPPFIVCEDTKNGNLCEFLARSEQHKRQIWRLLYDAALGIKHLDKKNIVHGDLKLANILVGVDTKAKLAEFGLSAVQNTFVPSQMTAYAKATETSLRWRAPEGMRKAPTFASDVYSFAMCMYNRSRGQPDPLDDESIRERLRNGKLPDRPDEMTDEVWELVLAMTNADPSKRMGLQQVIDKLAALKANAPEVRLEMTSLNVSERDPSATADLMAKLSTGLDTEKERALLLLLQNCVNATSYAA